MSRAVVEPAELRKFAQHLRRMSEDTKGQLSLTQQQLLNLGSTWRDQEHEKFVQEFQQQLQALGTFMQSTDEYVRFLLRKAERAEEYLQQR
ncbi:MAG: WXG100 family type VII secretion target [Planctomycetia bacterium]|nr:WXG100 family type VII secretion target [Planctomycetia bacterium]